MPNYRNKNRNRNKNKQRNKQQQQQQQQQQKEEICKKASEEASSSSISAPTNTTGHESQTSPHPPIACEVVTNVNVVSSENNVADVNASATGISNELGVCESVQSLKEVPDVVTTATTGTSTGTGTETKTKTKTTVTTTETNDTVLNEPSQCDYKSEYKHGVQVNDSMGNEKSKIIDNQREANVAESAEVQPSRHQIAANASTIPPSSSALGKVIVHTIVCEDSNSNTTNKKQTILNELAVLNESEKSVNVVIQEPFDDDEKELNQKQFKVIVHKITTSDEDDSRLQENTSRLSQQQEEEIPQDDSEKREQNSQLTNESGTNDNLAHQQEVHTPSDGSVEQAKNNSSTREHEVEIIAHNVAVQEADDNQQSCTNFGKNEHYSQAQDEPKVLSYISQPPNQHQAKVIVHQVFLEDKDAEPKITSPTTREPILTATKPTTSEVRIVEISDESLSDLEELRSPIVSEAESSIEYSDDTLKEAESITDVSPSTSTTSIQKQSRKQKRIALEHHFLPQMLNPRFLDSISEENSELSDNSENPLSRSASTESATNFPSEGKIQKLKAKFPKSSLDFSKSHKQQSIHSRKSKVIREEPVAVAVAARLQDAPNADESCTTVRSCMSPEAEAAEVVFINSASSSITDLHDMELYENVHTTTQETNLDIDSKDIINKSVTDNICFKSLTSSASSLSPSPTLSTFTAKIPQQHLSEFSAKESNGYNNNQIINNSKHINKNTTQTPHTSSTTIPTTKTRTLAETNANFESDSILLSSPPSSFANDQLVFAQIEEQISSVLSSINEVASQHTTTITTTTEATAASSSSSSSSSSTLETHTNLLNTQKLPVTTTSTTTSSRTLETNCKEPFNNTSSSSSLCAVNNAKTPRVFSQDENMNTVRDLINNNANDNTIKLNGNNENSAPNGFVQLTYNNSNSFTPIPPPRDSPPPPPIPPPSQEHLPEESLDECDNKLATAFSSFISASPFAFSLLQKNLDYHNSQTQPQHDFSKSLDSPSSLHTSSVARNTFTDSPCSDSTNISQCTAVNVAAEQSSDKSDLVQTSLISDLKTNTTQQLTSLPSDNRSTSAVDPKKLRLLCTETVASFPYGNTVLEELATVAQNIGEARAFKAVEHEKNMPYPLPELPHIDDLQLSLKVRKSIKADKAEPLQQEQSWLGVPTTNDPKVLVCLSPSQRSYIQQRPQQKPDDLLDAHQKFVERRGYHEFSKEELQALEREKLAEQQLLQTAAKMKKLRKSITPPPPQIPPPPVPVKSSETASKAQNLSKRTVNTTTITNKQKVNNDVTLASDSEQTPAAFNGESNGEENKHRLLSIMQDTNESNCKKQIHSVSSSSSSHENSSRQTTNGVSAPAKEQVPLTESAKNSYQFVSKSSQKGTENMQSVETTLGQMFPIMGSSNIFDQKHKRFSNIESSNAEPFCSQIMNTQPKRYSSIETRSYETQKRIENGKVIEDSSTSKHESETTGDKPDDFNRFPLANESNSLFFLGKDHNKSAHARNDQPIMSALNLTKHSSDIENKQQMTTKSKITIKTTTTETSQNTNTSDENKSAKIDEKDLAKQQEPESSTAQGGIQDTYEEFRQRAKAAADVVSTLPAFGSVAAATTTKVASNGDNNVSSEAAATATDSATAQHHNTTTSSRDHEKLFKDFDDLSKQLHRELETSKAEREQREKSASMFDLNRVHLRQKHQIEEFNKRRHAHFKELEREIERSRRSRSLKFSRPQETPRDTVDHQIGRTYEIPIHMENGTSTGSAGPASAGSTNSYEKAPPVPEYPKTYEIPIQMENCKSPCTDDERFRRAESMFNLSDDLHHRQRTHSNQTQFQRAEDDWSKYASDLGSSENIVRPFAKEVEICYQRRSGGIRAPRLTASTNDLSFNNQHSYDQFNAYNVRRHHHAPMLNKAPEQSRPKFGSCYSMIERDPNPKYISTTTRRGVSPAPQPSGFFPLEGCHVREEDMRQRRASLPRELHEQQLKYITTKEEELRTEFERLQSERRRLMEEAQRAQAVQIAQTPTSPITATRPLRDHYRSTQKLPTLTEDEVFRQQMAEEWLNKVAEREKRRLQNIIKISKIHEDEASSKHKADMEEEFLSRVKERRHKLAMPADSDWESGAESQPTIQAQPSEAEDAPPMKIIEGEKEASLRQLPRHLREFAKFSNHQKEKIEGGHREEHQEEERSEEATDNSVSRAYKKSSLVKTIKTLRAPMLPESHGHGRSNQYSKPNGYQSEPEPNYDSDYSTIKYRAVNPNRFQSASSSLNLRKSNDTLYGTLPNPVRSVQNSYKNQPGRIEDYVTGHSSVSEKEKKEWWDEIMDIFNVQLDQTKLSSHYTEGNLSRALAKESGYTSDSNLVFRKKEIPQSSPLSPVEQKQAYKNVQAGGEPPLFGFRKPAPDKSKVSPNRYYESDVNIHFKTPVRQEFKHHLSEEELAIRQAEQMQKLYQEERRRKYLQELQDMNSRRHTDNFTPSQKSPIALNRYDDFPADLAPKTAIQVKSVARALYNFQAQNSKELSFKKGDIIYIKRAIDKNWYEGEHNAMIGLFPANYVEIINRETVYPTQSQANAYRKPSEGQARAKYNFQAQSGVELSLNKGELVALTRRVDDNWFEGRIANRKGIFPVTYVEVLTDIGAEDIAARTTTIQQVSVINARPSLDALRTNINNEFNTITRNGNQPPNAILRETRNVHKTDILHVDTSSEPLVYRALYKYRPQNSDELELQEGDVVHVLEKCDDGWYVGTSQRTGCFGTFPGNYVDRI